MHVHVYIVHVMYTHGTIHVYTHINTHVHVHIDSVEGYSVRHVPKISLLELMQSPSDTNSAESTAQRLLQSIAAQFSSVDIDDMSVTQTVS